MIIKFLKTLIDTLLGILYYDYALTIGSELRLYWGKEKLSWTRCFLIVKLDVLKTLCYIDISSIQGKDLKNIIMDRWNQSAVLIKNTMVTQVY